jgi:hypothetical protein
MKFKLLAAALVGLALLADEAAAQLGGVTTVPAITFTGTTNMAGASTNTYAAGSTNVLYVENGNAVTISWRFKHVAANSGANVLVFAPGLEDGKPATLASEHFRFTATANGNTEVVAVTNYTVNGARTLHLISSEIPNANGITNSTLTYRIAPK